MTETWEPAFLNASNTDALHLFKVHFFPGSQHGMLLKPHIGFLNGEGDNNAIWKLPDCLQLVQPCWIYHPDALLNYFTIICFLLHNFISILSHLLYVSQLHSELSLPSSTLSSPLLQAPLTVPGAPMGFLRGSPALCCLFPPSAFASNILGGLGSEAHQELAEKTLFLFSSPILFYFILLGRVAPCATVWVSNKLQGPAVVILG